jgi:hypothetical protein
MITYRSIEERRRRTYQLLMMITGIKHMFPEQLPGNKITQAITNPKYQ